MEMDDIGVYLSCKAIKTADNFLAPYRGKFSNRENILGFSLALVEWMGLQPVLAPQIGTLRAQLYRLTVGPEPVVVKFAVVEKLNRETISRLVDDEPGSANAPYHIHLITSPDYEILLMVLTRENRKRILRLSDAQNFKIVQQWKSIATKSKSGIASLLWKSLDTGDLNKEFYIRIKEQNDALLGFLAKQYPKLAEKDSKMFAIRLIGKLIFCWFLKEKEIIPSELIDSKALEKYKNRYNSMLKPLFSETLNTVPYPERKYSAAVPSELIKFLDEIPYLNGGLFENAAEDALIPTLAIDDWLLGFVRLLEQYSFTVEESSPIYEQVAIDPEMLGKILENLLASLNPETEKIANERSALGSFYTPRPIVDYMVTESLKLYFQTQMTCGAESGIKEKLDQLFDYSIDQNFFTTKETEEIKNALDAVTIIDPACGSGAFPMGVLHTLVMLYEKLGTDKSPYDLRRSILSQHIFGVDILPMAVEISRLRAWLALVLVSDYKRNDRKHNFNIQALPNLDFRFVCANTLVPVPGNEYDTSYFFPSVKKGFDIVIGNPPYVRQENITHLKPLLKDRYKSFDGRADLYVYFYERSFQLLKANGILSFISSNKFFRSRYGIPLRKLIAKEISVRNIIDFGELKVFETASTFPMVFIAQTGRGLSKEIVHAQVKSLDPPYPNLAALLDKIATRLPAKSVQNAIWNFSNDDANAILDKIKEGHKTLKDLPHAEIYSGIKSGLNKAFYIDEKTRKELIKEDKNSSRLIRELARGDDVRKWHIREKGEYIIYTPADIDIDKFPAVKKHLLQFKTELEARAVKQPYWQLQQAQNRKGIWDNPKIVYPDICKESRFTLDFAGKYLDMNGFIIPLDDKYLLAVLNSAVVWWFLKKTCAVLGDADEKGRLRLKRQYVELIPIPEANAAARKKIEAAVEKMLSQKTKYPEADTGKEEKLLDIWMYRLYNLTLEEAKIIDPGLSAQDFERTAR